MLFANTHTYIYTYIFPLHRTNYNYGTLQIIKCHEIQGEGYPPALYMGRGVPPCISCTLLYNSMRYKHHVTYSSI